jgi:hypothetical protein
VPATAGRLRELLKPWYPARCLPTHAHERIPMSAYLPTAHNLAGFAGLGLTLAMFLLLGAACTRREETPEVKLIAGWGVGSLALTIWGVVSAADLRWPLGGLAAVSLAVPVVARWRARLAGSSGLGRIVALTLPLWLVMLPLLPSEIDTWWNLLPNAAYLFDYGMLPTAARPPSYSFIPVAPYNTQFAAFVASVFSGALADSAMGWFNIALLCAAGLGLARVVAHGLTVEHKAPPWWACAAGLLLAIPLNPGYVPRVFMSPYGEAPLAVTVLFAVWLATNVIEEMRGRHTPRPAWPPSLIALALVLAAMVNIKQSGLGLVLPVGATMLALALTDGAIPRRRAVVVVAAVLLPALALYGVWRLFATASFPEGELKLLPLAQWNWTLLPGIASAMLHVMVQKFAYFIAQTAVLVLAVLALHGRPSRTASDVPASLRAESEAIQRRRVSMFPKCPVLLRALMRWRCDGWTGLLGCARNDEATAGAVYFRQAVRRERGGAGGAWSRDALVLGMTAGIVVLFNGFLVFTYVAHFPPIWALEAHSYFRYSSQLSLAVMLSLVVALRPAIVVRLARLTPVRVRRLAAGAVVAVLVLPVAGIGALRFDIETPQQELRAVVRDAARGIATGARIALLLPGDRDDADASMVRGLLMFTPPRRSRLDLRIETKADEATLAGLARDGYALALVTCVPAGLADAPAGQAALLKFADGRWKTIETTAYPTGLRERRFAAMLQRGPVCAEREAGK